MAADGWRGRAGHLLVTVAGLVALAWAVLGGPPTVTCRGEVMGPGSVCEYASPDGSSRGRQQTYEQRLASQVSARPVVAVVAAVTATFGMALLVTGRGGPLNTALSTARRGGSAEPAPGSGGSTSRG